jgi:DNA (cytosine-5)-methyltransferase 1
MLTHFSLFSGIGGIDLAAHWAGFRTVAFCEKDEFCQKVLQKYWPGVPIWGDIRDVTGESFREQTGLDTVTLISAGHPCQPFSIAGKQQGKTDDRCLWPETVRVVQELRPTWFVGENVTGFIKLALDDTLTYLENLNYTTRAFVIPACAVGAPHRRDRVWIVAHTKGKQDRRLQQGGLFADVRAGGGNVANSYQQGLQRHRRLRKCANQCVAGESGSTVEEPGNAQSCLGGVFDGICSWLDVCKWPVPFGCEQYDWEPPRVARGLPDRVPRLRALGNAVVPVQVYPILAAIAAIEQARIDRMAKGG